MRHLILKEVQAISKETKFVKTVGIVHLLAALDVAYKRRSGIEGRKEGS